MENKKIISLQQNLQKLRALSDLYEEMAREDCRDQSCEDQSDELSAKNARLKMKLCRDELLKLSMETNFAIRDLAQEIGHVKKRVQ